MNADTLFLALLCMSAGAFSMLDPNRSPVVRDLGYVTPLHYLESGGYVIAGLAILLGLANTNLRIEIVGRAIMLAGVVTGVWRTGFVLGWSSSFTKSAILIFIIVAVTSYLRISVLLNKQGLHVTVPGRDET